MRTKPQRRTRAAQALVTGRLTESRQQSFRDADPTNSWPSSALAGNCDGHGRMHNASCAELQFEHQGRFLEGVGLDEHDLM